MTEATRIIAKLNEDMAASPVDNITTIDRQQLQALEAALAAAPQPVVDVTYRKQKLPPVGEELYEHYPSMSAQTHAEAVKNYARAAVAFALSEQAQEDPSWREILGIIKAVAKQVGNPKSGKFASIRSDDAHKLIGRIFTLYAKGLSDAAIPAVASAAKSEATASTSLLRNSGCGATINPAENTDLHNRANLSPSRHKAPEGAADVTTISRGQLEVIEAAPSAQEPKILQFPATLTDELRDALSTMLWTSGQIAACLRAGGEQIKTRAEDEQAHVLHWLISLALEYGSEWRAKASERIRAIRDSVSPAGGHKTGGGDA